MLIWGTGGQTQDCGVVAHKTCAICEKERAFHVLLDYRYFGLYWIFNIITRKNYWLLCEVCNRGWSLHPSEVREKIAIQSIPFMHRFGLGVLFGGIIALMVVGRMYSALAQ